MCVYVCVNVLCLYICVNVLYEFVVQCVCAISMPVRNVYMCTYVCADVFCGCIVWICSKVCVRHIDAS